MTAKFELESAAIAVETKRTKFVLLTEDELEVCTKPLVGFCAVKSALYPLNLNQFCVTALFTNDSKAVAKRCQTRVKLNTVLPMAEYISDGTWAESTAAPIKFNVFCHDDELRVAFANPLISIVQLGKTCIGSSDKITLPPYCQQESTFVINDTTLN